MSRIYPRFPGQLRHAYANVRDYGALGNGTDDDAAAIQRAVTTGRHVLFPKGDVSPTTGEVFSYLLKTPLVFPNEGQRSTFLSGAFLRLDEAGSVTINAPSQTFTGLYISSGTLSNGDLATPDPCLLIENADGLLLEDLRVDGGQQSTLVRALNTEGLTILGGRISGAGPVHLEPNLNVGLELGSGVKGCSAVSVAIDNTGHGVVFTSTTEGVSFVDCTIEQQSEDMIHVVDLAKVRGLSVIGLHTESGGGAFRNFVIDLGGGVYGAVFAGCQFGNLNETTTDIRRVFDIEGDWIGVSVRGCSHSYVGNDVGDHVVWVIGGSANLLNSCDLFNQWDNFTTLVSGTYPGNLPIVQNEFGALTFTANNIQIQASKIGFFGAAPVARSKKYTVGYDRSRVLALGGVRMVLNSLLRDLGDLGLIECEVSRR